MVWVLTIATETEGFDKPEGFWNPVFRRGRCECGGEVSSMRCQVY